MQAMYKILKYLVSLIVVIYYILEGLVLWFVPKRLRFKDVSNETVLITGGGSGLGRLFALAFARLGARVVLWDVNEKGNEETVKLVEELGGAAHRYTCDVANRGNVYETAAKVKDEVGRITILVNNAGIVTGKPFLDCPDERIEATFKVNVISHFWTLKSFLPDMLESNHGHVVFLSSMAGLCGTVGLSDYCASKHAVLGLEESLRLELQSKGYTGVHCTAICPYFINTGLFSGVSTGDLPLLDTETVVDEAMAAILINQEILMLPKIFYFLIAMKNMLPVTVIYETLKTLGIMKSMENFQGRKVKNS